MKKKLKDITIGEYMAVCKKICDEGRSCKDCPFEGYFSPYNHCRVMYREGNNEENLDTEIEMEEEKK